MPAPLNVINQEFQEKEIQKRAQGLQMPYIDLVYTPLNPDFLKLLDFDTAVKNRMVTFYRIGKKIKVAVEDPEKTGVREVIKNFQSQGYEVEPSLASPGGINQALKRYEQSQKYKKIVLVKNVDTANIESYKEEISALKDLPAKLGQITAEEGLNLLNISAMKTGASDAHYEPEIDKVVVRYRVDGMLYKVFDLTVDLFKKLANQIKYQAQLTLNVDNVPQDGRYEFLYNQQIVGVRVASIPTPHGESFVCRFLVGGEKSLTFGELGFLENYLIKLEKIVKISHGMVLITGPTGSGKSTTLYSFLEKMKSPTNKVITLEDPVEYHIEGVTQSQINEKRGYTFADGLRSILRHDPDIVMLGEIRDLDTAETAVQAALTGHVLLSTLHTNSAIETIPRLINMGLPSFMIAPSLHTIIGQRLVRKVCPNCVGYEPPTESEAKEFAAVISGLKYSNPQENFKIPDKIARVHGCESCSNTGYKGRMVIAELLVVTETMKRLIMNNSSSVDLIAAARKEGFITMREDGFIKVAAGQTTLEEVFRATNLA